MLVNKIGVSMRIYVTDLSEEEIKKIYRYIKRIGITEDRIMFENSILDYTKEKENNKILHLKSEKNEKNAIYNRMYDI